MCIPWFSLLGLSRFGLVLSVSSVPGCVLRRFVFDMVPGVFRSPVSLNHCFCVRFPTALRFFQTFWFRFGRPRRKDGLQPHPRPSWVSVHCFPIAGTLSRVLLGGFAFLVFLFGAIHCRADSVRFTLSLYFCTSIPQGERSALSTLWSQSPIFNRIESNRDKDKVSDIAQDKAVEPRKGVG